MATNTFSNEQSERISDLDALTEFRKFISESKYGGDCFLEDDFLLPFLKSRKYDLVQATRLLKNFFAAKKATFSQIPLIPSSHLEVLDAQYICPLHGRDNEGRRVFWVRPGMWDVSRFAFEQIGASVFLSVNERLRNSVADQSLGYSVICDLDGFSFSHARHIGILDSKNALRLLHGSFPVKVKHVHVIRAPRVFDVVWAFSKNFLSEKMRNRYEFLGQNLELLHKSMNPAILPEELGGTLKFTDAVDKSVLESLLNNEQYYRKLDAAQFE